MMPTRPRHFRLLLLLLGALALPAAAQAPPDRTRPADPNHPAEPAPPDSRRLPADQSRQPDKLDYQIGPGDVLRLFVWKEADLTRNVTVRVDGKITVPLLGDIDAAGRTPAQLGAEVSKAFARFLAAPQVTVEVGEATSLRFYVLGLVARPGDFPLRGRTTVVQALAIAGGLKEFAKADSLVIVREGKGPAGRMFIPINYKKFESGKDMSDNVVLQPGDTIIVP